MKTSDLPPLSDDEKADLGSIYEFLSRSPRDAEDVCWVEMPGWGPDCAVSARALYAVLLIALPAFEKGEKA